MNMYNPDKNLITSTTSIRLLSVLCNGLGNLERGAGKSAAGAQSLSVSCGGKLKNWRLGSGGYIKSVASRETGFGTFRAVDGPGEQSGQIRGVRSQRRWLLAFARRVGSVQRRVKPSWPAFPKPRKDSTMPGRPGAKHPRRHPSPSCCPRCLTGHPRMQSQSIVWEYILTLSRE